jgi:hypothetical protein
MKMEMCVYVRRPSIKIDLTDKPGYSSIRTYSKNLRYSFFCSANICWNTEHINFNEIRYIWTEGYRSCCSLRPSIRNPPPQSTIYVLCFVYSWMIWWFIPCGTIVIEMKSFFALKWDIIRLFVCLYRLVCINFKLKGKQHKYTFSIGCEGSLTTRIHMPHSILCLGEAITTQPLGTINHQKTSIFSIRLLFLSQIYCVFFSLFENWFVNKVKTRF